jgi:lipopolysaccharide transport system ATP-binding protein
MGEVARSGRTVLFVSHNLAAVAQLCQTGLLLETGRVVAYGPAEAIVNQHLLSANQDGRVDLQGRPRAEESPARFQSAELRDSEGQPRQHFPMGSDVGIAFTMRMEDEKTDVKLAISIRAADGLPIAHMVDDDSRFRLPVGKRDRSVLVTIPNIRLYPGAYTVTLWAVDAANSTVYDHADDCLTFTITDGGLLTFRALPRVSGILFISPEWEIQ